MITKISKDWAGLSGTALVGLIVAALSVTSHPAAHRLWLAAAAAAISLVVSSIVWLISELNDHDAMPALKEATDIRVMAGRDSYQAGRDINLGMPPPENGEPKLLANAVRISEDGRPSINEFYLCIRVDNLSDQEIVDCSARIESLEVLMDKEWRRDTTQHPMLLAWSYNDGGGAKMSIPIGSHRSITVAAIEGRNDRALIVSAVDRIGRPMSIFEGIWKCSFSLEATGYRSMTIDAEMIFGPDPEALGLVKKIWFTKLEVLS